MNRLEQQAIDKEREKEVLKRAVVSLHRKDELTPVIVEENSISRGLKTMKKLYIKQVYERTVDGENLLVVKTYESEPSQPYQIIFVR